MFLLHRPSDGEIHTFLKAQQQSPFSYSPVGVTRAGEVSGYTIDHNRVQLGSGALCFDAAVTAIKQWKMFDLAWLHLFSDRTPIAPGATVAVIVNHLRFWSMNACRIVYVVDERDRYGFAYGTLLQHAEKGEERFTIERNPQDDSVWYELFAVSKPGPLAQLAFPYARLLQKRFIRDSQQAMKRAVENSGGRE